MTRIAPDWERRLTPGARYDEFENGFRLSIPPGDDKRYRLAQIDDYETRSRSEFPRRFPLRLSLHARTSAASLPGTWGFGAWNHPFGFSIGFGDNPWRLPALPNAAWFFHASEENYLSFSEKPGNGFLAQAFRSPIFPFSRLLQVGLTFPFSRVKARQKMGEIVAGDGIRLDIDVIQWHGYRLEWGEKRCSFWVDDVLVLETSVSPRPPLGLVIWIDNQFAAWRPDGKIGLGLVESTEPAWLEIKDLELI